MIDDDNEAPSEPSDNTLPSPEFPAWLSNLAPPMPIVPLPREGDVIDHYTVVRRIGEGAFGRVYHVYNRHLRRDETLKLSRFRGQALPTELGLDLPRGVRIQTLSHHGDYHGYGYLTYYPYLEGESLAQHLQTGALSEARALRVSHDLAVLLRDLHARKVVHRDVKPSNVLVEPTGDVWLLDFGLASAGPDTGHRNTPCGTPGYVSPEQARGEQVDSRSDVFSAAVLLYVCLGGSLTVNSERTHQRNRLISKTLGPNDLRSLNVSRALKKLLESGCCLDPAHRPDITEWEEQLGKMRAQKRRSPWSRVLLTLLQAAVVASGTYLAMDYWALNNTLTPNAAAQKRSAQP